MREFRRALLPVFCVVLVLTPAFRAARPLPAQLSDAEFWQLVTDVSEQGGGFLSENLVSNELGYPWVMQGLTGQAQPGGAYLGVGPEQNFTYIAAVQPSIAFIVDIRRQNLIEHLLYKAIFELSENRKEFVSRLFARQIGEASREKSSLSEIFGAIDGIQYDPDLHRASLENVRTLLVRKHGFALTAEDEATLAHVYEEFAKHGAQARYAVTNLVFANPTVIDLPTVSATTPGATLSAAAMTLAISTQFPTYAEVMLSTAPDGRLWSYLATEENYRAVRSLHQKNLIVPIVGDFAGPKALRGVGRYLTEHDATVSVFYVSNVEQYLTPVTKLQNFYANVATLPITPTSLFIRSAQISGPQPGLAQSSIAPIQSILDAVLEGRAQSWRDILRLQYLQQ